MNYTSKKTALIICILGILIFSAGCSKKDTVTVYEEENYRGSLYEGSLFSEDLCVASEDVTIDGFSGDSSLHAAGLFDISGKTVGYAYNIHDRLYPASTTKILTALVALNHCSLDEVVTVSENAAASSFSYDAQVCGLRRGDSLTMESLLYGLLLYSGNDTAVAIAEYVGGSVEGFMEMVNAAAQDLMATNTHFVTPHGLHDDNHYTTAYDLYLIFNECIKHEEFVRIISADSYTADITDIEGNVRSLTWEPTNFYARGEADLPEGASVVGGKTGYTGEAGNCLILLSEDDGGNQYISVVMGAETKPLLYEDMSAVINQIPNIN